jgi:hypothetical protein
MSLIFPPTRCSIWESAGFRKTALEVGLIADMTVRENAISEASRLPPFSRFGLLNGGAIDEYAQGLVVIAEKAADMILGRPPLPPVELTHHPEFGPRRQAMRG